MSDFEDLERRLRERATAAADVTARAEALRPRVLAAMRAAQAAASSGGRRGSGRRAAGLSPWTFAASTAAAVVLLTNLFISAVLARPLAVRAGADMGRVALELQQLVPELDEREARRQALILEVRGRTPAFGGARHPGGIFQAENRTTGELEP